MCKHGGFMTSSHPCTKECKDIEGKFAFDLPGSKPCGESEPLTEYQPCVLNELVKEENPCREIGISETRDIEISIGGSPKVKFTDLNTMQAAALKHLIVATNLIFDVAHESAQYGLKYPEISQHSGEVPRGNVLQWLLNKRPGLWMLYHKTDSPVVEHHTLALAEMSRHTGPMLNNPGTDGNTNHIIKMEEMPPPYISESLYYGHNITDFEVLVEEDGQTKFIIVFRPQDFEVSASFEVYEINAWADGGQPMDAEKYLSGFVKWDGCSHFNFGTDENKGYIHLCGRSFFEDHKKVMDAIWQLCSEKIKGWNNDIAG